MSDDCMRQREFHLRLCITRRENFTCAREAPDEKFRRLPVEKIGTFISISNSEGVSYVIIPA